MWVSKSEMNAYNKRYDEKLTRIHELETKVKTLEAEKKALEDKDFSRSMENIHAAHLRSEQAVRCAEVSAENFRVRVENQNLRQILLDLTGKNPDELIEAHQKAVRILNYGVERIDLDAEVRENSEG